MLITNDILKQLKGGLIVSCQAEGDDPFNSPEGVTLFAKAAFMGGCVGIRSEGVENIKEIKREIPLPLIGLIKTHFDDGYVCITGKFSEVETLVKLKCDIIAIDGTFRLREGLTGAKFISQVKRKFDCLIMADIATFEEALACSESGADCISTTLNGYTQETEKNKELLDLELIRKLRVEINVPIFAEGRINTPDSAKQMIINGAWAVVVGTAITRPRIITKWYVEQIKNAL